VPHRVAARFTLADPGLADALVLSSPALAADLSPWQRVLLAFGKLCAPSLAQANGLDPEFISHDRAVVQACKEDPFVHNRVTARLASGILDAGRAAVDAAPAWHVPTLRCALPRDIQRGAGSGAGVRPAGAMDDGTAYGSAHQFNVSSGNEPGSGARHPHR
jgi:hypothetical protein